MCLLLCMMEVDHNAPLSTMSTKNHSEVPIPHIFKLFLAKIYALTGSVFGAANIVQ